MPDCGDGILTGDEPCDPGNHDRRQNWPARATCRWNPAGRAPAARSDCHADRAATARRKAPRAATTATPCRSTAARRPARSSRTASRHGGACTCKCGDGIVLSGEECDDGNNLSATAARRRARVESGFTCKQPPLGDKIVVPAVYRDFKLHSPTDFEPGATGQNGDLVTGLVEHDAGRDTASRCSSATANSYIASAATFARVVHGHPGRRTTPPPAR